MNYARPVLTSSELLDVVDALDHEVDRILARTDWDANTRLARVRDFRSLSRRFKRLYYGVNERSTYNGPASE